jgi:CelD/BcsL family acetyltransferase involved in cellulose biosynthesis
MVPMNFNLVTQLADLAALEDEWRGLLRESITPLVFMDPAYQLVWWETLGGGEWPAESSQLAVIVAREGPVLVGVAPLFLGSKPGFEPALRFIGAIEVSDYLDFIVRPENLDNFVEGLLRFLAESDLPVKQLCLDNLVDSSPTLPALATAANKLGWSLESSTLQPSPYIPLAESWDAYLAGIDKKQRHEIRRKIRNAETNFQVDWYVAEGVFAACDEVSDFLSMMRNEEEKDVFLTNPMVKFMRRVAETTCRQGILHLAFLIMDGEKAAAYLSFKQGQRLLVYNSAFNPKYFSSSPGWVLLAQIIQWAIANGFTEVDMMRGDEIYKYRFGGVNRYVLRAELNPAQA